MRYVIHLHNDTDSHYDLMLEHGPALLTWHITIQDMQNLLQGKAVQAVRVQDHRKKYLTYEGPVSRDRGMVRIYDTGRYDVLSWTKMYITIDMHGALVKGTFEFKMIDDNKFLFYRK